MFLQAAVLVPSAVAVPWAEAVQLVAAEPSRAEPPGPSRRTGLLRRTSGASGPASSAAPLLTPLAAHQLHLPVATFGNLTTSDATRLCSAMAAQAGAWQHASVRLSGYELDRTSTGTPQLLAGLEGDLAELTAIARGVVQVARGLAFRFDRRIFRPQVVLAELAAEPTTAEWISMLDSLERSVAAPAWTVDRVSLVKRSYADGSTDLKVVETFTCGAQLAG